MHNRNFSIIEISVVLLVILILMTVSIAYFMPVKKSVLSKNQQMEFDNIKLQINNFKQGNSKQKLPSSKYVTIYDLVYTYNLLSEKRKMLVNGNDQAKSNAQILSYFETPIEVYVTKQKFGATEAQIEAGYAKIVGHEYLTGDFAFYYGNDHEVNGGESGGPTSTPFGLIGTGAIDDAHQYFYMFKYQEPDNGPIHEYRMQL